MRGFRKYFDYLIHARPPAESIAVVVIIVLILVIGGPAVLQMREQARKSQRQHQIIKVGQGLHAYHDTFLQFPANPVKQSAQKQTSVPKPKKSAAPLISPLVVLPRGA